jgi:hypothetical protein
MHDLAYLAGVKRVWLQNMIDADPLSFQLRCRHNANYRHQIFYWQDGHLYRDFIDDKREQGVNYEVPTVYRDEFSYIHLQKRGFSAPMFDMDKVRGFYITPSRFVQKLKDEHCRADFIRFNPRSPTYRLTGRLKRLALQTKLRIVSVVR